MEQRFTFDAIATLYDAARPTYPDALFDDIAAIASLRSADPILEIGCGTGLATQGFARRGLAVLALDPGPALLSVARERLASSPHVRFADTTFENWPLTPAAFKLVAAAQSWHWVAPHMRFAKAAAALREGGFLAVFGNVSMPLPAPLGPALDALYAAHAPRLLESAPGDWYLPSGAVTKIFAETDLFHPPMHKSYPWTRRHDAASFVDLLASRSDCQLLEPAARDALTAAVADTIARYGEPFEAGYEAHLYMARRAD
jgi:SAM-dependent methyltransferase